MKHSQEIRLLRGISILGVIMLHVTSSFTNSTSCSTLTIANSLINVFLRYCIPLFVVISGFCMGSKYVDGYDLKSFYSKRLGKIVKPYLLLSLFYLPLRIYAYGSFSLRTIFIWFASGDTYYHFWYILLLSQLYLLYPLLRKRITGMNLFHLALILGFQILFEHHKWFLFNNQTAHFIATRICFSHIFYFSLGIWMSENLDSTLRFLDRFNRKSCILIFSFSMLMCAVYSYNWLSLYNQFFASNNFIFVFEEISGPFVYMSIIVLLYKLSKELSYVKNCWQWIFGFLGDHSFGIYLLHAGFLTVVQNLLELFGFTIDNLSYYALSFLFTIVLTIASCIFIERKTPYAAFIGSARHARPVESMRKLAS